MVDKQNNEVNTDNKKSLLAWGMGLGAWRRENGGDQKMRK
jgi:hypothetical protein